ncbi:MAG: hypothetical protein ACYDAQ_01885 [Mycobacteriales bacterium]
MQIYAYAHTETFTGSVPGNFSVSICIEKEDTNNLSFLSWNTIACNSAGPEYTVGLSRLTGWATCQNGLQYKFYSDHEAGGHSLGRLQGDPQACISPPQHLDGVNPPSPSS